MLATAAEIAAPRRSPSRLTKLALADGGHARLREPACSGRRWPSRSRWPPRTCRRGSGPRGRSGRRSSTGAERAGHEKRPPARLATLAFPLRVSRRRAGGLICGTPRRRGRAAVNACDAPRLWTSLWTNLWTRATRWNARTGSGTGLWTTRRAARVRPRPDQREWLSTGCGREKVRRQRTAVTPRGGYDAGPVAALRRIAFLLERAREDTYKVKAFRAAAATILPLPADEVAARGRGRHAHRAARHRRQLGAGDRRRGARRGARAAGRARGASTPARWPPGGARAAGRAARRPALPLRLVRRRLADRGDGVHRDRARPRVPRAHRPLAAADGRPRAQRRAADPAARRGRRGQRPPRRRGFTLLKGIEVDILDDGALDQTDELLGRLDVRVASVHSKLRDGRATR